MSLSGSAEAFLSLATSYRSGGPRGAQEGSGVEFAEGALGTVGADAGP
jgi:hypothetical protein